MCTYTQYALHAWFWYIKKYGEMRRNKTCFNSKESQSLDGFNSYDLKACLVLLWQEWRNDDHGIDDKAEREM